MYLLHSLTSTLHRCEGLSIDIRRLDRIYLLFQSRDLGSCLFESVFVLLLAFESSSRGCCRYGVSQVTLDMQKISPYSVRREDGSQRPEGLPFLFVLTFFLAIVSCSSIWFCKCLSLFCSISSCDRRPRIAFLGVSFLF